MASLTKTDKGFRVEYTPYKYILAKGCVEPLRGSSLPSMTVSWSGSIVGVCHEKENALKYLQESYNGTNLVFRTKDVDSWLKADNRFSKTWHVDLALIYNKTYDDLDINTLYVYGLFGDKIKFFDGSSIASIQNFKSGQTEWRDYCPIPYLD
jgi:hypothetical protein